jgi:trehalose 6-phosphate phosphatase
VIHTDEITSLAISLDHVALLLDIDGTLLDIAARPDSVIVPAGLRETLAALHVRCGGALALVSGRTLASIDRIFAPLRLPAIGSHGAQVRSAKTALELECFLPDALRRWLVSLANAVPGILIEDKRHSLAMHFRLAPDEEAHLMKALHERRGAIEAAGFQLLKGKAMVEVKPRSYNKGTALRTLMTTPNFAGRQPVFLGDDTTDEDVFRILPEFGGLGYSVGRQVEGTAGTFGSPGDVRRWLSRLATMG